jgi:hypothetical protein
VSGVLKDGRNPVGDSGVLSSSGNEKSGHG